MTSREKPRQCAYVVVPSRVEDVFKVRKVIGTLSRLDGFSEDEVMSLEVAVGEGLANAVRHGSPNGEMDEIEVTYQHVASSHIEVTIKDNGSGFDLEKWLEAVQPLTLSEGERGLFLIAELMDEVDYTLTEEGGCLLIRKYAPHAFELLGHNHGRSSTLKYSTRRGGNKPSAGYDTPQLSLARAA